MVTTKRLLIGFLAFALTIATVWLGSQGSLAENKPASNAADKAKSDKAKRKPRVLVFSATSWYRHPAIPRVNGWLVQFGAEQNMEVDITETAADLETGLDEYQVLLLLSTTDIGKTLNDKQKEAVIKWYRAGHGIVALHAAAVHHLTWDWFHQLMGCNFDSDSEHVTSKILVDHDAKNDPAVKGFGEAFFYNGEWLNYDKPVTGLPGVKVLLRVDEASYDPVRAYFKERGGKAMGKDHPVAWTREFEGGRLFYTSIGHDTRSLDTPFGRQHLAAGLRWAVEASRK